MRKKFESGSKFTTRKKKKFDLADLPSLQKKKEGSKFTTRKKKKIDIGKIAADAMKKGNASKFITKKSPEQIRDREKMRRTPKMGGGMMMGRRFGMKKGSFPDLNKDGKITKADILIGRGVIKKKKK
jgi:hypothetical protein